MAFDTIIPYEGNEPYVFISYSHRDKDRVYPVIERLLMEGYRVWYDAGINPGLEWPEIIAEHLNASALCFAFVSQSYLDSKNCKREVHFAVRKEIPLISIILEPVNMPLGMEMQLSVNQAINKNEISSDERFYQKLFDVRELACCKGSAFFEEDDEEEEATVLSDVSYETAPVLLDLTNTKAYVLMGDEMMIGDNANMDIRCGQLGGLAMVRLYVNGTNLILRPEGGNIQINDHMIPEGTTITVTEGEEFRIRGNCFKVASTEQADWVKELGGVVFLRNCDTDERDVVLSQNYMMGRSYQWKRGTFADDRVSRKHAMILWENGKPCVMDLGSRNKTFIDGSQIEEGIRIELPEKCTLRLGKHTRLDCIVTALESIIC